MLPQTTLNFKPEFLGERLSDLTAFLGIHTQF